MGAHIAILIFEEDRTKIKNVFKELSRGKSFDRIRVKRKHKSGKALNVSLTIYPLLDQNGKIVGASAISHDIAPELEAERNKELLLNIISNAHEAIIRLNSDFIIESWNIGAQRIYGFSESEIIGREMIRLFPREEATKIEKMLHNVLDSRTYKDIDTTGIDNLGNLVHLSLTLFPLLDKSYNVIGIASISRDITANYNYREMLEEEVKDKTKTLNQTISKLSRSNKALKEFAYVASHDLKSPLRGIASLATFIEEDVASGNYSEIHSQVQLLKNRVQRMDDLINGILQIALLQNNQEQEEEIVIKNIIENVKVHFTEHNYFELIMDESLPTITFNKTKMVRVFSNLIGNALKYNDKEKTVIEIGYKIEKAFHTFSVKDNGPGIEKSHFKRIFEMFQTLSNNKENDSTGIGLTIVKKIVEEAGGTIWVESEPEKGAAFYFTLPRTL